LQLHSRLTGLAGIVVPVWDGGSGRMAFIAPHQWPPFFQAPAFNGCSPISTGTSVCDFISRRAHEFRCIISFISFVTSLAMSLNPSSGLSDLGLTARRITEAAPLRRFIAHSAGAVLGDTRRMAAEKVKDLLFSAHLSLEGC
jgi:hypothetical protein